MSSKRGNVAERHPNMYKLANTKFGKSLLSLYSPIHQTIHRKSIAEQENLKKEMFASASLAERNKNIYNKKIKEFKNIGISEDNDYEELVRIMANFSISKTPSKSKSQSKSKSKSKSK